MVCIGYAGIDAFDIVLYIGRTIAKLKYKILIIDLSDTESITYAIKHPMDLDSKVDIVKYRDINYTRKIPSWEELTEFEEGVLIVVFGWNYTVDIPFELSSLNLVVNPLPNMIRKVAGLIQHTENMKFDNINDVNINDVNTNDVNTNDENTNDNIINDGNIYDYQNEPAIINKNEIVNNNRNGNRNDNRNEKSNDNRNDNTSKNTNTYKNEIRTNVLMRDMISLEDIERLYRNPLLNTGINKTNYLYMDLKEHERAVGCQLTQVIRFQGISARMKQYILDQISDVLPQLQRSKIKKAFSHASKGV